MAERYQRLFSTEKNLYSEGSPLIIAAGALLKDSFSSNMLAQLKLKSVSTQKIIAAKVSVTMLDATGKPLGDDVIYQYPDLDIQRDGEFGRSTAIVLPDPAVRAFAPRILEVAFEGGSSWVCSGEWSALGAQKTLEEKYGDAELANQYRIRYGADCKYAPEGSGEIWFCTCGSVNFASEAKCHSCRRSLKAQQGVNISSMRSECADRVKAEQEQEEIDAALAKKKNKKRIIAAAIALPIIALIIIAALTIPKALEKNRAYDDAVSLLNEHEFSKAQEAFAALGDYRDSAEQAEKNVLYMQAVYIMECAANEDPSALSLAGISRSETAETPIAVLLYNSAIEQFSALGGYRDSESNIEKCRQAVEECIQAEAQSVYDWAVQLLEDGHYCRARDAFEELGSFGDSESMAKEAIYRKALSLFGFIEKYDIRGIYAALSTDTEVPSVFYISKDAALKLGTSCISDLNAACGGDAVDVRLDDTLGADAVPLSDALTKLFGSLGKYGDAASYKDKIAEAIDYTREFFNLCKQGDLYGAYDWLTAYEDDFPNREQWLATLEKYKPFCSDWVLYSGDATLLPMTAGKTEPCQTFSTCVLIDGDTATLRFTGTGAEEFTVDFPVELGSDNFVLNNDDVYFYYTAIPIPDHLAYMKYDNSGNLKSSCEYERA